jgi:spore maturation protein SpmA
MANLKAAEIGAWLVRNKLWTAFVLVIIFGYVIGKDAALRENANDAAKAALTVNG